jgi:hypothetical protein
MSDNKELEDDKNQSSGSPLNEQSHYPARRNRGRRLEELDEEKKRQDEEFWNNNPLFKGKYFTIIMVKLSDYLKDMDDDEEEEDEDGDDEYEIELVSDNEEEGSFYEEEEGENEGIF